MLDEPVANFKNPYNTYELAYLIYLLNHDVIL
jgi:hypothetical protein